MNDDATDNHPAESGPAPVSPGREVPAAPLSRGLAVLLVALNLAALGWLAHSQDQRLDRIEAEVGNVNWTVPAAAESTDPQVCWLLGVLANAQGKGDLVAGMGSGSDSLSECQVYGMRGARGQNLTGS